VSENPIRRETPAGMVRSPAVSALAYIWDLIDERFPKSPEQIISDNFNRQDLSAGSTGTERKKKSYTIEPAHTASPIDHEFKNRVIEKNDTFQKNEVDKLGKKELEEAWVCFSCYQLWPEYLKQPHICRFGNPRVLRLREVPSE